MSENEQEARKQMVAAAAVVDVQDGMRLGLGSGSTVNYFVEELGRRARMQELRDLTIVAASSMTEAALQKVGLPVHTLNDHPQLDLAVDGADEITPDFAMIKGGGRALLRERIVLAAAATKLILVDHSKVVPVLGTQWAVPVEVVQFGWRVTERLLRELGSEPVLRLDNGQPVITDEGNYLLDCTFGPISDPHMLSAAIAGLPGVMAHGIFLNLADRIGIAGEQGVEWRVRA